MLSIELKKKELKVKYILLEHLPVQGITDGRLANMIATNKLCSNSTVTGMITTVAKILFKYKKRR